MIAQRYVALLDLLALASLPTALSLAQRYVALLDLLALASLPAAFSAPALLGPLDHDFLSTIIPVVAATGPEVGNLLNIAHRYGGVVLEPRDDADPAETWVDDPKFSALALNATKPAGYDIIYQNLHAATTGLTSYLTVLTLPTYSPSDCATACTTNKDCVSYNLYLERSPSIPPTSPSNRNPPSQTLTRCALYASLVDPTAATNTGQYQLDFHVAIAASNGYTNSVARLAPPPGFGPPEPFGARAIDAPRTCKTSYLGLRTFSAGGGAGANNATAARRCAAACDAHNKQSHDLKANSNSNNDNSSSPTPAQHRRRQQQQSTLTPRDDTAPPAPNNHPNGSGSGAGAARQCAFFNSYMLYNNSAATGVWQCALFADVWVGAQATNRGQFRGADKISVGESWGFRRMGLEGNGEGDGRVTAGGARVGSCSA